MVVVWLDRSQEVISEMNSSLLCWNKTKALIFSAAFPLSDYYIPRSIFPDHLWVPFGDCLIGQYIKTNMSKLMPRSRLSHGSCYYNVSLKPSSVTLNPSPGERFDLILDSWDDFYKNTWSQLSLTVL